MKTATIVGGGLAGLSAAVRLTEAGWKVRLLEARRILGGRAGTFVDSGADAAVSSVGDADTGESAENGGEGRSLDHCQHVALGCCTQFLSLCRQVDALDLFTRHSQIHFLDERGRRFDLAPLSWLPAPLHFAPALLKLGFLSWPRRIQLALALRRLAKAKVDPRQELTVAEWLREQRQPQQVIDRFWTPVLVSALSETLDRIGLSAAQKVVVDSFYASRTGHELYVPNRPLDELHSRFESWLARRGAVVQCEAIVREIVPAASVARDTATTEFAIVKNPSLRNGWIVRWTERGSSNATPSNAVVVAVPWYRVVDLLAAEVRATLPALDDARRLEPGAITSLHLWFDRPITALPHAVLLDRLSQWLFRRPDGDVASKVAPEYYHQIVISAAHSLAKSTREELLATVLRELRQLFPAAAEAKLVRSRILTDPRAVFRPLPGHVDQRPAQRTNWPGLALAGDWTRTGWPATMEGAVRSGTLAADALTSSGDCE